jgi:hypothetical protein
MEKKKKKKGRKKERNLKRHLLWENDSLGTENV